MSNMAMGKKSFGRSCLFFSISINCIWIFVYFYHQRVTQYDESSLATSSITSQSFTDDKTQQADQTQQADLSTIDVTDNNPDNIYQIDKLSDMLDNQIKLKPYIFIGGVPSSGTTLSRAMLDAHPDVRCGEETRLVPRILQMRERWIHSKQESKRLKAAGLDDAIITRIVRNFVSNVIELHGAKADYLCNKDPLSLSQMPFLHDMFPKAKFLLMIRDGRAVANSIVSRNITITGVDHKSYLSAAQFWNKAIEKMWLNCQSIGEAYCLPVYFEKLVEMPKEEISKILEFLNIPWSDNVLHHSDFLASEVSLSKFEPSSKQVSNAINPSSADKWKKKMSPVMQEEIWMHCPMLQKLGYDRT